MRVLRLRVCAEEARCHTQLYESNGGPYADAMGTNVDPFRELEQMSTRLNRLSAASCEAGGRTGLPRI